MSMKYLCQNKQQYLMVMQVICRPKYFFWALLTYKSLAFVDFLCLHRLDRVEHAKSHPVHLKDFFPGCTWLIRCQFLLCTDLTSYVLFLPKEYSISMYNLQKHWSLHLGEPISMYNLNKMLIRMAVVCLYCSNVYGSV